MTTRLILVGGFLIGNLTGKGDTLSIRGSVATGSEAAKEP
jgi:hypothetical protein